MQTAYLCPGAERKFEHELFRDSDRVEDLRPPGSLQST